MNTPQHQLASWLSALVLLPLLACNQAKTDGAPAHGDVGSAPKALKLGFVTNNASPFWKSAAAGLRKYEGEAQVQVDMKMPQSGTAEDQNRILRDLSAQGYDAIAVSVIAPREQLPVLNDIAGKTPLITFDSDAETSKRLLYIGTNNFEAGKALGQRIAQLLPEGGKIAVFVGSFSTENASQRLAGVQAALKDRPVELIAKREDDTDRKKARTNVEELIRARKDLGLVVGLWNYNGPAIAAAIEGLGKQGKVQAAVFDEDEATLDAVERGTIAATVVQKPFQFGYLSAKWLHSLAAHRSQALATIPGGSVIDTGVTVIDKTNVAAFRAELYELRKSAQ